MASRNQNCHEIHDSSRRRFVRNSLATSMSISFAGLIRAHGGGGGGTTTYDPEATTYATTEGTTGGGGTTTWDPEATTSATTYATTGSDGTTTWDPEAGTTTTENTTTVEQEETTAETTATPITYHLESHPTGTPPENPGGIWESYSEVKINDLLETANSHNYQCKIKYWVTPADGKSPSEITIEYCAEFYAEASVPAGERAPSKTTAKLKFTGTLPDNSIPAMGAELKPDGNKPKVPTMASTEPNPITGLLANPKPAELDQGVFDEVTAGAPSGADSYAVYTFLSLDMSSIEDFTNLPLKANVVVTIVFTSSYRIAWFLPNGTVAKITNHEFFKAVGGHPVLEIRVEPDI